MKFNNYEWQLYVNYGTGYEYETTEDTFEMYKVNKKAYQENCKYPQRWKVKRIVKSKDVNKEESTNA